MRLLACSGRVWSCKAALTKCLASVLAFWKAIIGFSGMCGSRMFCLMVAGGNCTAHVL